MGGWSPVTRTGLIALIAARRIKAEKLRRLKLAEDRTLKGHKALEEDARKERGAGWFRR